MTDAQHHLALRLHERLEAAADVINHVAAKAEANGMGRSKRACNAPRRALREAQQLIEEEAPEARPLC